MMLRKAAIGSLGLLVLAGAAGAAKAPRMAAQDKGIIERLLSDLKGRDDLHFVRKDKVYSAGAAVWYMKFKWDQNQDKIGNVEDFIALESVGGEHGEVTYFVQFADGSRRPAREVLEAAVEKLRQE